MLPWPPPHPRLIQPMAVELLGQFLEAAGHLIFCDLAVAVGVQLRKISLALVVLSDDVLLEPSAESAVSRSLCWM